MKISPIKSFTNFSKPSFKGMETDYVKYRGEDSLKESKFWHKNSSIDKTLGSYHSNQTGRVYYASPLEPVSDAIKDRVDYVVYDNEPAYPKIDDIEKNYLGNNRKNYREDFEEVRNYYYRREMGGYANKADAQYQQWQAAECTGFYDRAGDARFRKECLEDSIKNIEKDIIIKQKENLEISESVKNTIEAKQLLEKKQENYLAKNKKYAELNLLTEQNTDKDKKEIDFIESQIKKIKSYIKECEYTLKAYTENIALYKNKIISNNKEIENMKKNKKSINNSINEIVEKELKPMFNSLKEFYTKQGIKIIK